MSTETKKKIHQHPWVRSAAIIVVVFGAAAGYLYWTSVRDIVSIDTSHLEAPMADVVPAVGGVLNTLYVQEGDRVAVGAPVAVVGSETLYAKEAGVIASAPQVVGSFYQPGQSVAKIVVDGKMRLVGLIDETDGLDEIRKGQHVTFTVDSFGGREYEAVVDEVAPASNESGIAFSISDKRPTKKFNVYMTFDTSAYPELKSGMSAKSWIDVK